MNRQRISIVIPALNEARVIQSTLKRLQPLRAQGHEVILVDGGSSDTTCQIATPLVDRLLEGPLGRARQMNFGATHASGEILWFLHADTLIPKGAAEALLNGLRDRAWGRFNVRLSGAAWMLRVVERMMNLRSCFSGICTGDQGLFLRRSTFLHLGGFPEIALMEDIELSTRLRHLTWPRCLPLALTTSSRRWEQYGVWRTIWLMWSLRLAYFLGAEPGQLARRYSSQ